MGESLFFSKSWTLGKQNFKLSGCQHKNAQISSSDSNLFIDSLKIIQTIMTCLIQYFETTLYGKSLSKS